MLTKKKLTWFGFALIILLVVAGIAFADELRSSLVTYYARSIEGAPAEVAAGEPQIITGEKATVRLTEARASGSHTAVEFLITDFTLPDNTDAAAPTSLHAAPLLNGDSLKLSGFTADTALNASERKEADGIRFALELPPLTDGPAPATIIFERLQIMVDDPVRQRAENVDLGGPWTFHLTGQMVSQVQTRPIEQRQSSGPVTVVMAGEVQLSDSETLLPYQLETPPGMEATVMVVPELQFDNQTFEGRSRQMIQDTGQEAGRYYSFPALPSLETDFTIEIGPFLVTRENPIQVTLDVAQLRNGGQTVIVQGHALHFVLDTAAEGVGFELRYEPADEADARFMLKGKGSPVQLTDNGGQTYTERGGTIEHAPQRGLTLKSHTMRFAEPLSEDASQFILTSGTTGEIVAPIQIRVTVE